MNTALLLIDIQKDYFEGGKNELANTEPCIVHAKQALSLFRERKLPIIYIQHISLQQEASFFLPHSEGIKIHDQIAPQPDEKVIVKHFPDSFLNTELEEYLKSREIKRLVVCGMMSHMCIDTTVRTAKRLNYGVVLLGDACTTKALIWKDETIPAETVHNVFMASLQGTFAEVIETRSLQDI